MNIESNQYIDRLLQKHSSHLPEWIDKLEQEAKSKHVPIMEQSGIAYLLQILRLHQPKSILEVGTAIGYSALRMHDVLPEAFITTIERDEERFKRAVANVSDFGVYEQFELILGDAHVEMDKMINEQILFDCVFIDASKGQYEKFFEAADVLLKPGGIIITDNVLFRGYVIDDSDVPKRYANMVKKLQRYNDMLFENPSYISNIVPVGDGVAISIKQ